MDQDKFDDFDDIDLDDIEDLDDDWDDFDGGSPSDESISQPKKKSSLSGLITLLIILIFVGVGLFILYTTFKPMLQSGGNAANPQAEVASQNAPLPTEDSDETALDPFFAQDDGLPPMPTPLAGNQPTANNPELTPLPEFDDIELEPLPDLSATQAPVQQEPAALVEPVVDIAIAEPQPMAVPETNMVASQDVVELSNRLDSLQNDMTSQLSERDFRLDLLNEKMSRIEKTMMSIESRLATQKTLPAATVKPKVVPKKVAPKKVIKKSPAPKTVEKKTTSKPKKLVVKKTHWTLRSAQPGKATVSPVGSKDIRSISVGETLSGIGRIQSISNASGKWVVTGTTGRVSQ